MRENHPGFGRGEKARRDPIAAVYQMNGDKQSDRRRDRHEDAEAHQNAVFGQIPPAKIKAAEIQKQSQGHAPIYEMICQCAGPGY